MARKESLDHGKDDLTLLIELLMTLTPNQIKNLYADLKHRYSGRAMTKTYNELGEIDKDNGKVRLTKHQYTSLRTKYGDTYMNKALHEMTKYIKYLELHSDESRYRNKLEQLNKRTHCKEFEYGGWVYDKCKSFICQQDGLEEVRINPFLIDDISVARKYIESLPPSMRQQPDVLWVAERFPELMELLNNEE